MRSSGSSAAQRGQAFVDAGVQGATKMEALLWGGIAFLAILLGKWLNVRESVEASPTSTSTDIHSTVTAEQIEVVPTIPTAEKGKPGAIFPNLAVGPTIGSTVGSQD